MKNEFKVGDTVRVKNWEDIKNEDSANSLMKPYCCEKAMISSKIDDSVILTFFDTETETNFTTYVFTVSMLEHADFTKKDLRDGDRIILRNGEVHYFFNGVVNGFNTYYNHCLTNNLTDSDSDKQFDVIEVERPIHYVPIFKRDKKIKMTKKEIEKKLGCEIEIVEEKGEE